MDIKSRLVNYFQKNQFIQKYIKGLNVSTNEVVLSFNGEDKSILIDELEKITDELTLVSYFNHGIKEEPEIMEVHEEIIEEPSVKEPSVVTTPIKNEESMPNTASLDDIKILTELKNKIGLDNMLNKFAINEATGLIDFNKAISIVEENTIKEVVNSIKEDYYFDTNPINYDITGKFIGERKIGVQTEQEKIMSSFNNIRIFLEAGKMYPEQVSITNDDINKKLQDYFAKVKDTLNAKPISNVPREMPVLKPVTPEVELKSAGFADVLVLSVIVLVYAVIIVNLILRLS